MIAAARIGCFMGVSFGGEFSTRTRFRDGPCALFGFEGISRAVPDAEDGYLLSCIVDDVDDAIDVRPGAI